MSALGIVLPYYFLINYLQEEGASWSGFWADLYLTNPMSMVTMDITVAAFSFLILIIYQYYYKICLNYFGYYKLLYLFD